MRTILTGKRITSDEAVAWGLACDAVDGNVLNGAVTVASAMRSHGVQALEFAKEAICRGMHSTRPENPSDGMLYSRRLMPR